MIPGLIVTPEAAEDIRAAFTWYEERRTGLGFEFNACVDTAMNAALRFPEAHPVVEDEIRRRCRSSSVRPVGTPLVSSGAL